MSDSVRREDQATFILEGYGGLPTMEMRQREDGTIEFRYLVEEGQYPGFDDRWRVVSEREQRDHLRMGGRIAEWLRSVKGQEP